MKFFTRNKKIIAPLALLILVIGVAMTVFHSQQTQQHAAGSGYPASEGHIYWDGGWETGDTSQWADCCHVGGHWGNSSIHIVTSPVRWGTYAAKLTLNPSSKSDARAEISASQEETGGYTGQEWFYSFSVYFPSNPDQTTGWDDWNNFTQWMDMRANCSPPLQFDVTKDSRLIFHWELATQEEDNCGYGTLPTKDYELGAIVYDQWIDFTAHIKWSEDPNVGFAQVWRNGQEVVPLTHMQTLDSNSQGVYMEQAMYRPTTSGTSIIYIDGTRRHDAYGGGVIAPVPTLQPATILTPTGKWFRQRWRQWQCTASMPIPAA